MWRCYEWHLYDMFPSRFDILLYNADILFQCPSVHVGCHCRWTSHKIPPIKIFHCMSIIIFPPLGKLPKMNFPFQLLLSPPQGEELKSRAARVAKKSFPWSRASYETDHRVERSEQAMKGRGRAEAEGGEKRAHAPDQSTTNGSPPWAWGNRKLLTQSAGQSTLDQ